MWPIYNYLTRWANDFYSHIPCGMWLTSPPTDDTVAENFYSHIPCGMWLCSGYMILRPTLHFYSHIPCGMWLYYIDPGDSDFKISTHTSRVGCDWRFLPGCSRQGDFYSHIPCGMWQEVESIEWVCENFYSHIPCGMRRIIQITHRVPGHFYSHIPCGMWQHGDEYQYNSAGFLLTHPVWDVTLWPLEALQTSAISTHTSRVGCDTRRLPYRQR